MDDPGWRPAFVGVVPFATTARFAHTRRAQNMPTIIVLRRIFLSFSTGLIAIGVVVGVLTADSKMRSHGDGRWFAIAVLVGGIGAQLVSRVVGRELDATSVATLRASYQARFFLRMASAESAALLGFVGFILTRNAALYLLGAALLLPGAGPRGRGPRVDS
jgi:hypothetical protein